MCTATISVSALGRRSDKKAPRASVTSDIVRVSALNVLLVVYRDFLLFAKLKRLQVESRNLRNESRSLLPFIIRDNNFSYFPFYFTIQRPK